MIAHLSPVCGEGRLQGLELAMTVSLAATPTNLSLLAPSPASSRRSSSGGSHVSRVSRDSRRGETRVQYTALHCRRSSEASQHSEAPRRNITEERVDTWTRDSHLF